MRGSAFSATAEDTYPSNTALYADPDLVEGVDYRRRFRNGGNGKTTIIAPHGGGVEAGTSELCLAIAGYEPSGRKRRQKPVHGYWMFEGLRPTDNADLHVTSTNCDDPVAVALCASSQNVLAVHGCVRPQDEVSADTRIVLVGGADATFRYHLLDQLLAAGFQATDAASHTSLGGNDPANIANRTARGKGAQLEITTALRSAMFDGNTRSARKKTTTQLFWAFVNAARAAIAAVESTRDGA
jgi:phage replication-related protein YjqB (UPF0714/DUF867 family)